ncbi:MAG: YggT family protein [Cyanobacteria bacterium P01_A01_bin.135]
MVSLIAESIGTFLSIYSLLLIIRILLSWFPNIDWLSQPFAALSQLTDPYLNLFRSIIPSLGGIDLSPILAILAIQFAQTLVAQVQAATVSRMFY